MHHDKGIMLLCLVCVSIMGAPHAVCALTTTEVRHTVEFSQSDLHFEKSDGYDVIRITDASVVSELGKPVLPVKRVKIAIPNDTRAIGVEAHSVDSKGIPGNFFVMPGQPPLPVGQRDAEAHVDPEPAVYESNIPYPGDLATLDHQSNLAGQQIVHITVYPVDYMPSQRKLQLHTRVELTVHCVPDDASENAFQEEYYRFTEHQRRLYEDMLKTMVANPEQIHVYPRKGEPSPLVPPGAYDHVIITTSALESYFQPLIHWHMKKGIRDTVITTEWIYANYTGPDDTLMIRQFVIDANTNWGTMYFLMGGEGTSVPYAERHYYGSSPDQIAPGDQYYSDFDDDWVHEVYVGRVSGDGDTQINTFINKVLKYEKDPPLTDYPAEVLLIGMDLDDDTPAELLKDSIATFVPSQFTINKVYDSHGGNHEDSVKYYLGTGNNLVNHMDHSNKTVMGAGYHHHGWTINNTDVDNLTNDDQMSIITSGGCEPAAFDYDDCIGEHFVIYNDLQAGVAFIGNSRHGWYYGSDPYSLSSEVDFWFWHGVFTQGKDDVGKALVYAKHQFATPNDWDKACEWNVNLLGEPAMLIWTDVPETLVVTHDTVVPNVSSDFTVIVMEDDGVTPLESALVCCWIPGQTPTMQVTEYTDASGTAVLSVSPSTTDDTMYVTVTKQNYIPYEGHAIVISSAPPTKPHITQVLKLVDDIELIWNRVTTDTLGNSEIVDYYVVYRNTSPSFVPDALDSIGTAAHPDTTYQDVGALATTENYYYLVQAVDGIGSESKKSNMAYVFNKIANKNEDATDKNWVGLPYRTEYGNASGMADDLSPSGDPLTKLTNLRADQLYESWSYTTVPFPRWTGTNFVIVSGRGYEMVAIQDDTIRLVGCNEPDGLVSLNENPAATDKNWVSIPYNAVYGVVEDIVDEYSPSGDPLTKVTNLRDDQLFESWSYTAIPFPRWTGTNFAIEPGRGYEFVTTTDTTWNPTEFSNETSSMVAMMRSSAPADIKMHVGALTEPDRTPLLTYGDQVPAAVRRDGNYREVGVSHLVRGYFELPGCEDVMFTVYRPDGPYDLLTENMVGCGYAMNKDFCLFWFDTGNFKKPWQNDEVVILNIEAFRDGLQYSAVVDFTLDEKVDIQELGELSFISHGSQGQSDMQIPRAYAFDIFPNPFINQIRIDYALPLQTKVEIIIYDVVGRQIKTVTSAVTESGYYSTVWNGKDERGRDVSSGIYLVRFEAGSFRAQNKILFVK